MVSLQSKLVPILRWRAAGLGMLGRVNEGRMLMRGIHYLSPNFPIACACMFDEHDQNNIMKSPRAAKAFYQGLRRSGAPEG